MSFIEKAWRATYRQSSRVVGAPVWWQSDLLAQNGTQYALSRFGILRATFASSPSHDQMYLDQTARPPFRARGNVAKPKKRLVRRVAAEKWRRVPIVLLAFAAAACVLLAANSIGKAKPQSGVTGAPKKVQGSLEGRAALEIAEGACGVRPAAATPTEAGSYSLRFGGVIVTASKGQNGRPEITSRTAATRLGC